MVDSIKIRNLRNNLDIITDAFEIELIEEMIFLSLGNDQISQPWYLGDCYNLLLRALIMLTPSTLPDTDTKKMMVVTILLSGSFLYWIWEATLIANFSIPTRRFPFQSLEELLENTDKKVCIL